MTTDELYAKYESLTSQQHRDFIDAYAERMVDDMDTKCLMQFVFDAIVENLSIQSPQDVIEQISYCYDEETIQELIESVQ